MSNIIVVRNQKCIETLRSRGTTPEEAIDVLNRRINVMIEKLDSEARPLFPLEIVQEGSGFIAYQQWVYTSRIEG